MIKRFIILLFSAFLALAFTEKNEAKECADILPPIEVGSIEEVSPLEDAPLSEYGIPRQNTYSSPTRTLQAAKRTTSSTNSCGKITFTIKSHKNQDSKSIFRTLAYGMCGYFGISSPQRLLISLRKLII